MLRVRVSPPELVGPVAQWSERATHNRLVAGSIPAGPTAAGLVFQVDSAPAVGPAGARWSQIGHSASIIAATCAAASACWPGIVCAYTSNVNAVDSPCAGSEAASGEVRVDDIEVRRRERASDRHHRRAARGGRRPARRVGRQRHRAPQRRAHRRKRQCRRLRDNAVASLSIGSVPGEDKWNRDRTRVERAAIRTAPTHNAQRRPSSDRTARTKDPANRTLR